jgi:c(7)-type cytochrome triheme protein
MKMKIAIFAALALSLALPTVTSFAMDGKSVFNSTCIVCHGSGLAGAPRKGSASDWKPRIAKGIDALYHSALHGTDKGMPMKGGNHTLTDREVKLAVDFMVEAAKGGGKDDTPADKKAEEIAAQVAKTATVTFASATDINSFNRLLKPAAGRNQSPAEDGIHDPANDGTMVLLPPAEAFAGLPKGNAGNWVNWVAALNEQKIKPRYDRVDPTADAIVMDLNIVREVKGSMPNVVYPHKQHTQWLDCSNCHPAIFIPQKGANQISMAMILLGQKCGVCHGKVAFPVSECRRCHSQKKEVAATSQPASTGKK